MKVCELRLLQFGIRVFYWTRLFVVLTLFGATVQAGVFLFAPWNVGRRCSAPAGHLTATEPTATSNSNAVR